MRVLSAASPGRITGPEKGRVELVQHDFNAKPGAPRLMGRRWYGSGDRPEDYMHYNDLRLSLGWPGYMRTVRWHLLRLYQQEFAELLGTNKMQVSRMERGDAPITPDMLRRVNRLVAKLTRTPAKVERAITENHWGGAAKTA